MWIECPSESRNRNRESPARSPWQNRETAAKTLQFNTAFYSASVKAIKWFPVWGINLMLHNIWQLPHLFFLMLPRAQISVFKVSFITNMQLKWKSGYFTWKGSMLKFKDWCTTNYWICGWEKANFLSKDDSRLQNKETGCQFLVLSKYRA